MQKVVKGNPISVAEFLVLNCLTKEYVYYIIKLSQSNRRVAFNT